MSSAALFVLETVEVSRGDKYTCLEGMKSVWLNAMSRKSKAYTSPAPTRPHLSIPSVCPYKQVLPNKCLRLEAATLTCATTLLEVIKRCYMLLQE